MTDAALQFRGANSKLFECFERECLLEGPAGTGKTMALCAKAMMLAEHYPKSRILLVRKTRVSMTQSVLVTLEQHVMPEGHPALSGPTRAQRDVYVFPNGSEVVVGGLDNVDRIMSTDYDLICVFEATEATEEDAEKLMSRLRHGKMGFQQIVYDCNPSYPTHWLNRRANDGKSVRLKSRHEDNPVWFNNGQWTKRGEAYMDTLRRLTGSRRRRLFEGVWSSAEGMVYEAWDESVHMVDEAPVLRGYFGSVDWGWTNPGVLGVWGFDGDGRIYCVAQVYRTEQKIEWWVRKATELNKKYDMQWISCDPSEPMHIRVFQDANLPAIEAVNDVIPGIRAMEGRLANAGDGRPRMFFVKGNLVERDEVLVEKGLPCCAEEEITSYCWQEPKEGLNRKEEPVKFQDHGMDMCRYAVMHADMYGVGGTGEIMTIEEDRVSSYTARMVQKKKLQAEEDAEQESHNGSLEQWP